MIPRKELLSALLTARLINSVKSALEHFINIKTVNCWLDSSIALHWIKNNQFIENRRQEIRKLVEPASFNYCPTGENPADLTSRGSPLSKLKQNSLWLHGPKFLTLPPHQQPRLKCELTADQIFLDTQEKKQKQSSVNLASNLPHECLLEYTRFSSFYKLLRLVCLVLKFVRKLRKKETENEISILDLQEAENVILHIQQDIVSSTKFNQVQKSLGLFYDDQKILRCEGRLSHAPLEYAAKFPILLPECHSVTTLIVRKCHQTV